MNFSDIASLMYRVFNKESFYFYRNKTDEKEKENPIVVPITPYIEEMIKQYGNKRITDDTYVFPILQPGMDSWERSRAIDNFIRLTNQHLKPVAEDLGFPSDFSTYYARHTYSTLLLRLGKQTNFIQKALGHKSVKTTENYLDSFGSAELAEVNKKLLDF